MKQRKLLRQSMAALLSLSLLAAGVLMPASHADAAKNKIKLNKTKLKLTVGKKYKLKLSKKKGKIKWTSSKKKVATVNAKGVVKAKKAGKATITALMKGKKYKCKVTVKKAKPTTTATTSKTPSASTPTKAPSGTAPTATTTTPTQVPYIPTPNPGNPTPDNPTATPGATGTEGPSVTQGPTTSDEPVFIPEELTELEQKITIQSELLANHMLITVTNTNDTWVDNVVIYYNYFDSYYDSDEEKVKLLEIATGNEALGSMKPDEKRYISVELSEHFDQFDPESSLVYPNAEEADEDTAYLDYQDSVDETDTINLESRSISLNITNHSKYDLTVPYAVLFYNEDKTKLIDAYTDNDLEISHKNTAYETIPLPIDEDAEDAVLSTNYEVVYSAYMKEQINDTTPYIDNITFTPQKITSSYVVFVDVKNTNKEWLTSLSFTYYFYNKEDEYISEATASLLSMAPGETQTVPFNLDPKEIAEIDLDNSYGADIDLYLNDDGIKFDTTQNVTCTTAYNTEENYYELTLISTSNKTTEGTCLIKYYADTAKKELIGAELYDYDSLPSGGTLTDPLNGVSLKDENGNWINVAACDATIQSRHTVN